MSALTVNELYERFDRAIEAMHAMAAKRRNAMTAAEKAEHTEFWNSELTDALDYDEAQMRSDAICTAWERRREAVYRLLLVQKTRLEAAWKAAVAVVSLPAADETTVVLYKKDTYADEPAADFVDTLPDADNLYGKPLAFRAKKADWVEYQAALARVRELELKFYSARVTL